MDARDGKESRPASVRAAVGALLAATCFWGFGFTWAKQGGEAVNDAAGVGHGGGIGPIWLLAVRFLLAGVIWLTIFPAARRGWTRGSIGRAALAGTFLAGGLITQHLGLDRASEAVTAFLTSLTILFVPLLMTLFLRRPPPAMLWGGVGLATVGVWLMTGASPAGIGLGEVLGLACAVIFSLHLISVNLVMAHDEPARMAAGQFIVVGLISTLACLFVQRGPEMLAPARTLELMLLPDVRINLALMVVLVTLGAFGLQTHFQPRLDPTRAALLYLMEPIFASAYAWVVAGRGLGPLGAAGAALILLANVLVEVLHARRAARKATVIDAGVGAAIVD